MTASTRELGFRMPAEWEPHEGTWLAWCHNPETWPGRIRFIPKVWIQMIKDLHLYEKVHLCVNDEAMKKEVEERLKKADIGRNVFLHLIPTNDCWTRDHGPICVVREQGGRREVAAVNFGFNAWGGKYPPWDLDDAVPPKAAEVLGLPLTDGEMILEGGSIEPNGLGTLLTTEQCLLNKNRNPHLSRAQIEGRLKSLLGVTNILWLGEGIAGDDTDGHVDDVARFVGARTVLAAVEDDPAEENYRPLRENLLRLGSMKDQEGRPFTVLPLPMPRPVVYDGQRLPASYANFYIGNGCVLVPVFNQPSDETALAILRRCFPKRRICPIVSNDLVLGLGAFHCVTQPIPARD